MSASARSKRSSEGILTGFVFAITGTLSEPRAKFEEYIIRHGGEVVKSVTNACTHLVSAETGTKKCEDALAKGIAIVDEQWVRQTVEGLAPAVPDLSTAVAAAAAMAAVAKVSAPANQLNASTLPKSTGATGKSLRGMVICITGTLSVTRAEFEKLIIKHGGKNVKSVNHECTHLVASADENGTKKYQEAEEKGIPIVDESYICSLIVGHEAAAAGDEESTVPRPARAPVPFSAPASNRAPASNLAPASSVTPVPSFVPAVGSPGVCVPTFVTVTASKPSRPLRVLPSSLVSAAPAKMKGSSSSQFTTTTVAANKKKTTAKATASSDAPLAGMVICITGTLSVSRAAFEKLITQHGGKNVKAITKDCTHLVAAEGEAGTKKYQEAEAKGIEIVDEEFIHDLIEGEAQDEDDEDDEDEDAAEDEDEDGGEDEDGDDDDDDDDEENYRSRRAKAKKAKATSKKAAPLADMVICITGTLSVSRAAFEKLITQHGGKNVKAITKDCTHLVAAEGEAGTKKYQEAEAKGIEIVDEDFIRRRIDGDEDDDDEDGGDDDNGNGNGEVGGVNQLPTKQFQPVNQPFRRDRATIHLYSAGDGEGGDEDEDEEEDEEEPSISPADWRRIRAMARRGDLLENVASAGYRSSGIRVFDGRRIIDLDYDVDDYGQLPPDFVIYGEFNPHYWDYATMNVNNTLVPDATGAQSYWHTGNYPSVTIDGAAIAAVPGLSIDMYGETYTFPQTFKDWVLASIAQGRDADGYEYMEYVDGMSEGASVTLGR